MEQTKQAIAVLKVNLAEWLAEGKMDGSPITVVSGGANDLDNLMEILDKNNIGIDDASQTNDWVDLTRSVDDRVSVLTPGSFIVVWDNGAVSLLDGVTDVTLVDGQPVVQF